MEHQGKVKAKLLRGNVIYDGARIVGPARGEYLCRPLAGA
jgi:hypothetical protein